jgi:NADH-quinone oxidoreductase subunit N
MDLSTLLYLLWPELLLVIAACVLFLMGVAGSAASRRMVPAVALLVLVGIFAGLIWQSVSGASATHLLRTETDPQNTVAIGALANYIKLIAAGMGVMFVFLAWPTNSNATGNAALDFGSDCGEFFALMLLAICGVFLVASANDMMLLFLGIELASIPTYIMVSISRPLPVAQEAGVKYFFLGAMSAAIMLFGFSYLYGTTGTTSLAAISSLLHPSHGASGPNTWQLLAIVMLLAGFAFKIAAVPLHAYAGDVYQGAATPVTALLAFVPKTSGFVAIIKILAVVGGAAWIAPDAIFKLLWVLAILTMTFGNALGLLQFNIKRVLAYSSVAHSGYMLVGLTALLAARSGAGAGASDAEGIQQQALTAVLFYLAAYGIMNTGAFGVLMLLPGRADVQGRFGADGEVLPTAGSAETFEDIAGSGRRHPTLGLAMLVCCLSLTGLPLTIGFFGKVLLIKTAWAAMANPTYHLMMAWLVVATVVNAAISAAYYLRIVAAMYLRADSTQTAFNRAPAAAPPPALASWPVTVAVVLSVVGTLFFGIWLPGTDMLTRKAQNAAQIPSSQTPGLQTVVSRD